MADEPKTKEDVKNLMKHLKDEYRKANISEKTYKEMKEKYKSQLLYIENTISTDTQKPAETPAPTAEVKEEKQEAPKDSKPGLFGKIFHKAPKEEKQEAAPAAEEAAPTAETPAEQPTPEQAPEEEEKIEAPAANNNSGLSIEIEKLKVMLDSIREQKKATDDSLQSVFESVGELRSMIIQSDATAKELTAKMEHTDDEISQVKPKEIDAKFREMNETLEKYQVALEKMQKKTDDMSENINKTYEILKSIGNIENLSKLNDDIQHKLEDIKEAMRYVERLSAKDEKMFIDLKGDMEDIVVYKAKQDALDDTMRDVLKNLDGLGVKFEAYSTKKDMEQDREDIIFLKKELENVKKSMGIVQSSLPETIVSLRKERDDINLFLGSLEEQLKEGKLRLSDYESIRKKNLEKLKTIDDSLQTEWKTIEALPKIEPKPEIKEEQKADEKKEDNKKDDVTKAEVKKEEPKKEEAKPGPAAEVTKKEEAKPEEAKPSEDSKKEPPAGEEKPKAKKEEKQKLESMPF